MPVRAKTPARARAAARPVTTVAKARTLARARAAARPMAPSHPRSNPAKATIRYEGWETSPGPLFFKKRAETAMPGNRFNALTDYGIGIALRAPHYDHILSRK